MENEVTPLAEQPDGKRKIKFDKHRVKQLVIELLPIAAMVLLFAIYLIFLASRGATVDDPKSFTLPLTNLFRDIIILAIVSTGAIFIYSLGSFDISLGASLLLSASIGVIVYNSTNNLFATVIVILLVAVGCSLLSSTLASVFKLPVFVTTVAMMSVLSTVTSTLINKFGVTSGNGNVLSIPSGPIRDAVTSLDELWFFLIILAVYVVLCVFVFNFTKVGRRQKFLGANPFCARLTGISINKYAIIAFAMAGLGVGLGAFLVFTHSGNSISMTTQQGIGMEILIAIVFGGMPISGGPRSRIYAALVGGTSYKILNAILAVYLTGIEGGAGIVQIISAVFFLAVVFVASINYRTKNLPR